METINNNGLDGLVIEVSILVNEAMKVERVADLKGTIEAKRGRKKLSLILVL